jgi:hypothetical protein
MATDKIRENRLRRMADRQGLVLRKSARRDPRATDYGLYALVNRTNAGAWDGRFTLTLEDVERHLTGGDDG